MEIRLDGPEQEVDSPSGQPWSAVPEYYMRGRFVVIVGARLYNRQDRFLGYWHTTNIPLRTLREWRKLILAELVKRSDAARSVTHTPMR